MGADFPSLGTARAQGVAVACRGEHLDCTAGAHLAGTVAPTEMMPSGTQRHVATRATACQLRVAQRYCSTRLAGTLWCAEGCGDKR